MNILQKKLHNRAQRKGRIRSVIIGTSERPRLHVYISNQHISAQITDDISHKTLVAATTIGSKATGTMTEKAAIVGTEIAKKAGKAKITAVVFDRGGKLYHGRVAALAASARKEGLEF